MRTLCAIVCLALPVGAQSLRGRVVDDLEHEPVSRARFSLAGGSLETPIAVYSNDRGEFEFTGIAAGRYRLSVEKAGFFTEAPVPYEVTASEPTAVPEITLVRQRTLSGTVLYRDGLPATGVYLKPNRVAGTQANPPNFVATVGDRGEFGMYGLRPGCYVIDVVTVVFDGGRPTRKRDLLGNNVDLLPNRSPLVRTHPQDRSRCFDLETAATVTVQWIVDDANAQAVTLEGTVSTSRSVPAGTRVSIALASDTASGTFQQFSVKAGDPYQFTNVAPGAYILGTIATVSAKEIFYAVQKLVVGTQPMRFDVPVGESAPITGKIESLGSGPEELSKITVNATPIGTPAISIPPGVAPNDAGEFEVNGSRGIPHRLGIGNLPPNGYVTSITQGSRELPYPYAVETGGDPVRVVVKLDSATVEGRVMEAPVSTTVVVLAPAERGRSGLARVATIDERGAFRITTIPPGSYTLFAVTMNRAEYLGGVPDVQPAWEPLGTAVELGPSAVRQIELQLIRQ